MAHPRKRNEAEDRKRLRRTLKRSQLRQARKEAERSRKQRGKGGVTDGHGLQGRGANLVPEVKAVRRELEGKRGRVP